MPKTSTWPWSVFHSTPRSTGSPPSARACCASNASQTRKCSVMATASSPASRACAASRPAFSAESAEPAVVCTCRSMRIGNLAAGPAGGALLGEGARTLFGVLGLAQRLLDRRLQPQAVVEVHVLAAHGQLFDRAHGERRVGDDLARVGLGRGH